MKSNLSTFYFVFLVLYQKCLCLTQGNKYFIVYFTSARCGSRFIIFLYLDSQLFHYYNMKKTAFSPVTCFCFFVENQLYIYMYIYFYTLYSVPLMYFSIFTWVHFLHYCSFRVSTKITQYQFSTFVILFKLILHILGHFKFNMNFRMCMSFLPKKKT